MIQVIDRALDILEYVAARESAGISLREISDHLSLNQATCANIIKSLTKRKYLEHIGPKKGFRLGPMATFLIGNFTLRPILVLAARDTIDRLSNDLNENCLLGVIHQDKRILVYSTTIDHDLSVRNKPERSVYDTATGRLLLAFLKEHELTAFIDREGLPSQAIWKEASTKEGLLKELTAIRDKKIVVTQTPTHVVGVAVPVWKNEKAVAALSTYLPESRYSPAAAFRIDAKLRESAAEISKTLNNS
jgi:IclR family KDG regulon transcriptional repressor